MGLEDRVVLICESCEDEFNRRVEPIEPVVLARIKLVNEARPLGWRHTDNGWLCPQCADEDDHQMGWGEGIADWDGRIRD